MTFTESRAQQFLRTIEPFDRLPQPALAALEHQSQFLRYRIGQSIAVLEQLPLQVSILCEGQIRLLGKNEQGLVTLQRLQPREIIGWISQIRGVPCEIAIAATESVCLNFPAQEFLKLLHQYPEFADYFHQKSAIAEVFDLLTQDWERQAFVAENALQQIQLAAKDAEIITVSPKQTLPPLSSSYLWFLSSGVLGNIAIRDRVNSSDYQAGHTGARLVGLPMSALNLPKLKDTQPEASPLAEIPYAPELTIQNEVEPLKHYPISRGQGPVNGTLACFQMVSQSLGISFRRDMVRHILEHHLKHQAQISLQFCGAVAESIGLTAQLVRVSAASLTQIPTPAIVQWQAGFAVLYKASDREIVLGVPEQGLLKKRTKPFTEIWGEEGDVLLLKTNATTPQKRFGLHWFVPALLKHRRVLIEVLIASVVVQLIGLANPIVTQVIIDKVLIQNSADALTVLGVLLVVVSIIEAILTNVRTQLFADTTNRIDLALGSEVINHLLKLPLPYFEKRSVGELSSRVNELENIRQFLTGTALTAVLDAIFALIYVGVMIFYNPMLTVVALSTVPLFAILILVASPMIRRRVQRKAERHSATNAYLIETLSGIQTVKAQNLELRSRWQWQDRYSDYISAGFEATSSQTATSSISNFLNKLSSLLVLLVGAYLVMNHQLTLGSLIAFRIIAGYATSPILRFIQLWQNFQETALSLQRLSDVLDTPQEQDEDSRSNILMPTIVGSVSYKNVSFRFRESSPLQLSNINLDIPAGSFVGVVGQSGSGKSTLTKLIPRLYQPESGQIAIDSYDINKVELYSLRQQIGIVMQDNLLFDGTIRDNIAIAIPDASDEQIIEAAKIAFAHDFIMSLAQGYSTKVGERGAALSGGQRQRIAIARTVLQNPRILILDEATSALDYLAERQVCTNLMQAFHDRTIFFITHRLTTLRQADLILMMDQGAVLEQGTYEELMAMKGMFYCLERQSEKQ